MIRQSSSLTTYIVTFSCPNRPGIVAAVSQRLFELGANITEAQQFDDMGSTQFFMRIVLNFRRMVFQKMR